MELLFEIEPVSRRDKLVGRVRALEGLVDWLDIPDSPMGRSRFFSPLASCIAKNVSHVKVVAHLRVIDVSRVALESILKGLELCNVERIAFVRGDLVEGSTAVRDVEPEDAVKLAKSTTKLEAGLTISLRKPIEDIEKRLSSGADFYLVLNLNRDTIEKLEAIERVSRKLGVKLYPYVVLLTEANRSKLLGILERWKLHEPEEALKLVEASNDIVDGVLISSPGDFQGGLRFVERLRKR